MMQTEKNYRVPIEELIPILLLQLEQGGKAPLQVTGNSMYPMLQHGRDRVILEPLSGKLKKGDLIFYRRENGGYILHRIVKCLRGDGLICCGDNQHVPEAVAQQQVIARVTAFTRKGKTYGVTDPKYRLYVWVLTGLFPVRKPLLALRGWIGNLRRRYCK